MGFGSMQRGCLTARRAASDPCSYTEEAIVRVRGLLAAIDYHSGGLDVGYV